MKVTFIKDAGSNIDIINSDNRHYQITLPWFDIRPADKSILCSNSTSSEDKKQIIENQIVLLQKKIDILKSIEF